MSGFERPGPGFDVAYARARVPDRTPVERTPAQKAADARAVADNLEVQAKRVRQYVHAMTAATATAQLEDWTTARSSADAAVAELDRQVSFAVTAVSDAADPEVRKRLAAASKVLTAAQDLVAGAPAAPEPRAPQLTCADALLAALPPDRPVSPAGPVYDTAERALKEIFLHRIIESDITALRAILHDHRDHEIARRFVRFGKARQDGLRRFLERTDVKLPARAREASQRRAAQGSTTASGPTSTGNDARSLGEAEPVGATAERGGSSDPSEAAAAAPAGTAEAATGARADGAEPREAYGPVVAAQVPGVTYQGTGVFRVATGEHQEEATVQRVGTGVPRVRRKGGHVVLEIPTGLDDHVFVDSVAEQLRVLRAQLAAPPAAAAPASQLASDNHGPPVHRGDAEVPGATAERQAAEPPEAGPLVEQAPAGVSPESWALVSGATVQRKVAAGATSDPAPAAPPEHVAARGVAGAGGPLPYIEQIQASFGQHDVSGVTAHQGPEARQAAGVLGAQAFAFGDAAAFAASPDLHTAAHEAAHVVQQRGGVQLQGNLDQPGDDHERHADAVADRVVAGQSAEPLLDQVAGGSGAPAVVQRRAEPGALVTATEYLKLNDRAAGDAILRHLLATTPPQPHPRLAWNHLGAFYKRFFQQLDRLLYVFDHPPDLAQLVYPQDPYAMIDDVRPVAGKRDGGAVGPWDWRPSVGTALAEMIEEALVASLYRIGPRWLHIAELAGDVSGTSVIVDPDAIPRSHAMDRAVVPALCQQGVLDVLSDRQHRTKPRSSTTPLAQPAGVGLRPVQYVWLGKETRGELWNWVRAISPADATVEEVSAQLFSDTAESHGEKHGDYLAFAMTSAPPLFGLPGHWAIKFDEGKAYAPATVSARSDAPESNLVTLAGSSVADDQALREANVAPEAKGAKPAHGTAATVGALAQDALSQATYLKRTLGSWRLENAVDPTLAFLGRRMGELADAAKLATWQPVLAAQKDKLSRIGAGIVEIDRAVATMGISNKQGNDARPLREILRLYADAAGASHLVQTSEALLQRAATLQATLPLRGLQGATRDLGASADLLRDSTPLGDPERDRLSGAATQIDEDARTLQSRMMRGAKVEPDEVDRVMVDAGEIALKSKVHAIAVQLEALEKAAHDAGDGFFAAIAALFSSDFRGLEFETQVMKDSLEGVTRDMDWQAQAAGLGLRVENARDLDGYRREMMRVRKEALARAQGQFATMAASDRIKTFLSKGATLVKWQSFRTACVKLAVLIGVSIVGGAVGGMVARGVGDMLMTSGGVAAMEDLSMGAQLIARGSGLAADTAVASVGQTAIFGDKLGDSLLENLLMSLGSAGVLKAIGHQAETLAQIERASEGLWTKAGAAGRLVLQEGAAITGHTIMGAALGYVSHRIVTGKTQPPPETLEEWLLQGASIAIGRYVGKAMEARAASARRLAAIQGFAAGQKLLTATTALHERARRAEASPQPKEAAELLARRHEVLSDELKALDELEKSPELMKASGLHLWEVKQMRAGVHGQLDEVHARAFAETPLHLAGLEELIPSAQWKGTHEQIAAAIESAKHAGAQIDAKPPHGDGHAWHVELEGRPLEIVESDVGAHPVPGSTFSGIRGKNEPKPKFTEHDIVPLTAGAVEVLNLGEQGFRNVMSMGDNRLLITNGAKQIRAKVTIGEPMPQVATHDYKPGATEVTIRISKEANLHDITRATAHEIAEIQTLLIDPRAAGPDALVKGSTSDKLSAHDEGRLAELRVLLYELDNEPSLARRDEVQNEIDKLLDHVGLDKQKVATDERAKKVLGPELTKRVDQLAGKRLKIKASELDVEDSAPENGYWSFTIKAKVPGFKRPPLLGQGGVSVDAHGLPEGGPHFTIDKRVVQDGSEYRIDIEGIPSLTDFALTEGSRRYEKRFGHPPTELPGSLGDDNKAIFQRAYVTAIDKGVDPKTAEKLAAAETPFVQARARRGYKDIDVKVIATEVLVVGIPPQKRTVPTTIHVIAKRLK